MIKKVVHGMLLSSYPPLSELTLSYDILMMSKYLMHGLFINVLLITFIRFVRTPSHGDN